MPAQPSYDTSRTRYSTRPPIVIYAPTSDPWYYHDYYYGRPWYWRMWHTPTYYGGNRWGWSWTSIILVGVGIWFLLGLISAMSARRRRY